MVDELASRGLGDVVVFGGGIIPGGEIPALQRAGVAAVFTPGAPIAAIAAWLEQALDERDARPRLGLLRAHDLGNGPRHGEFAAISAAIVRRTQRSRRSHERS